MQRCREGEERDEAERKMRMGETVRRAHKKNKRLVFISCPVQKSNNIFISLFFLSGNMGKLIQISYLQTKYGSAKQAKLDKKLTSDELCHSLGFGFTRWWR